MWLWIKDKWQIALGLAVALILWLRFIHDPQVRKQGQLHEKKKRFLKRLEAHEESEKDTVAEEEELSKRIDQINKELNDLEKDIDPSAAANRMREWFSSRPD